MNNITLVVMAAGMGSRYGGLKQLDKIGPSGETIIDYSVYDSINAGFDKVVFIIRKDFERIFKTQISNKYLNQIEVKHVFQSINDLPGDYVSPSNRIKPWGTGQAILCAESEINSPFVVINADDFYGHQSFLQLYDYFNSNSHRNSNFTMVAYTLNNTLSENGSVTRGVCKVKNNFLVNINETENIYKKNEKIESDSNNILTGRELVSMNMWGFNKSIFNYLRGEFLKFLSLTKNHQNNEFLLPSVINKLIEKNKQKVYVLNSESIWFGVTYKDDKSLVESKINKLIKTGIYPEKLF